MSREAQKKMVRFDFPPGATAKEIGEALTALRHRLSQEKAAAKARALGEATTPTNEKDTIAERC